MTSSTREPGWWWAALWRLALSGGLFVVVYSACNQYTATRGDVGQWVWEWEKGIPFVPELVIPYWSLDLFFCGAFFVCRSRVELNLLTRRLVAVTLASGLCYLLFPLRMALERPVPSGWTAPLFHALYFNDLPHNLAPSLHISLRSLVWIVYGAHWTGWLRQVTKVWFILIGLSTLLVWQHHLMDVATGFLMGWAIAAVLPDPRRLKVQTPSLRLAGRYATGALVCGGLAWIWFPLVWPAASLAIMALAYGLGRPHLLGKENGTLSPAAEWCLLPVLLATSWIQRKWRRGLPAAVEVSPGVWFGRRPSTREARAWLEQGPLAALDLTAESNSPRLFRECAVYRNVPMLDLVVPAPGAVAAAVEFIAQYQPTHRVFIQCQLGLQRSATVAAQWLLTSGQSASLAEARARVLGIHPRVVFHAPAAAAALAP